MSEKDSDDSIESIVAERLDSIFGDDEEEPSPPPATAKPSPLSKLEKAVESLHAGITPQAVDNLASEVRSLGKPLTEDPLFRPLLKISGVLIGALRSKGETTRRNATKTMASVFDCMKTLAEDESLPISRKRALVQREIEAFKAFRESTQEKPPAPQATAPAGPAVERVAEPTPKEPPPEAGPAPPPEPAPSPEAIPEKPAPEHAPAPSPEPAPKEPPPSKPGPAPSPEAAPEQPPPEARTAPAPPTPQEGLVPPPETAPRSSDTVPSKEAWSELQAWIGRAVSDVKDQIQEVKAALPARAQSPTDEHEELARIAAHIKDLSGVPQSLKILQTQMLSALVSLKKSMDALPKSPSDSEPVRAVVREELDTLKHALKPVLQVPSDLQRLEKETRASLTRIDEKVSDLQQRFDSLRDAVRATRLDLNRLRSFAEGANESLPTGEPGQFEPEPPVKDEELPLDSPYGRWEWEETGHGRSPGNGVEEGSPRGKAAPAQEEPVETEAKHSPVKGAKERVSLESPSLPSGQYFLFYTGGRKYAVDARYMVKSTRIGGAITKKARSNGSLTLADVKSVLSSPRKGIEPKWQALSDQEIKETAYALVPDPALDGLAATNGGGALFLATEEKTLLILSDEPASKVTLSEEDEIQMATASETSQSTTCGSILRSGEGAEFYLILAPERLAERIT